MVAAQADQLLGERLQRRIVRAAPEYRWLERALRASDEQLRAITPLRDLAPLHRFLHDRRPANLHLNGCGDFCFERRRQIFLCESTDGDAEVQQEKDSKAWGFRRTHSKAPGFRPETRKGNGGYKSAALSKWKRAREIGRSGHE